MGNLPPCSVLGVPTSVWDLSGIMFHQYEPRRGSGASAGLVSGRRLGPVSIAGTRPRVPGDGCLETISAFDLPPDGMVDERAPKRRAPEGLDIQRSDVDGDLDPVQPWVVEADGAAVVAGV